MTRRKDGLWQQQMTVTVNGCKKQKCFYGKTKQEVLKKIAAFEEEQERGVTFETVADEWWREHEPTLAYNTTKPYKPAIERAKAYFGKTYIKQIKPTDINRFLSEFIRVHHAALKTAKTQLMVMNLICKYATANGYIDVNPARELSVSRSLPKTRREMPSDDDVKLVKACTRCTFGMFAYWVLYTGCRRGELLALTWEDVNLDTRTITVSKSVYVESNKPKLKQPKTEAGIRVLPLMTKLLNEIKPGNGLIFPDPDGGLMTEMHFQKLWKAYVKDSGVTCTPHQLRHAYATMLFENDVPESDAQELLGHANIQTTKDVYTHIREARKAKVREGLFDVDIT